MEAHKDNFVFTGRGLPRQVREPSRSATSAWANSSAPATTRRFEMVREKFKFRVSYQVIPDGNQWDGMFDSVELEERMKREAEADLRQQFEDAQQHLWLTPPMHDVAGTCGNQLCCKWHLHRPGHRQGENKEMCSATPCWTTSKSLSMSSHC